VRCDRVVKNVFALIQQISKTENSAKPSN
jgi:hypothetical protein